MNGDGAFEAEIAAAQRGEEWALRALYRRLHPRLLRYLSAHEPRHAERLAHDVWVELASRLHVFAGDEGDFRVWLFAIAHLHLLELELDADDGEPVRFAPSTETALARFAALPRGEADVILLRALGELNVEQVAQVVGNDVAQVRALQERGIHLLARYGELVA